MQQFFKTVLLLLLCAEAATGQITLQAFQFRPIGDLGFFLKPGISVELGWADRFDNDQKWRISWGGTYMNLTPRLDTFPVIVIENGTRVLPGVQSFSNYDLLLGFVGFDYKILEAKQWQFFVGANLIVGVRSVRYEKLVPGFIQEYSGDDGLVSGVRFRAGVEYLASDKISVFLSGDFHQFAFYTDEGYSHPPQAYSIGLGIRYAF